MQFNSYGYMIFLPLVTGIYFVVPKKLRTTWLLLISYLFYICWSAKFVVILLFTTCLTYAAGCLLDGDSGKGEKRRRDGKVWGSRKLILAGTVIVSLMILFFFKYFNFFLDNVNVLLAKAGVRLLENPFSLILPVGLSYYTFQVISYLVDVYKGKIQAERNFVNYALFVSFFPKVVMGPIERAENLMPQIRECEHKCLWDTGRISDGAARMIWGYFLKMVLADRAAIVANTVFDQYWMYGSVELFTAATFYTVQIFCDFAAYTNVALGTAKILGFSLQENFRAPYFARTVKEHWARWHISLSSWLRDYVYIPLGGNRHGKLKKYRNIMLTFLASGLWHGSSWNYVLWGGIHGIYQVTGYVVSPWVDRFNERFRTKTDSFSYKFLQTVKTFLLVDVAFIFFRAPSASDAVRYFVRMCTRWNPWALFDGSLYTIGISEKYMHLMPVLFLVLMLVEGIRYRTGKTIEEFLKTQCVWFRWGVLLLMIMSIGILGAYGNAYEASNFIYFQF